jgi:hypothetical protein
VIVGLGIVTAVHNSPGPASGILYDVDLNWPDGTIRSLSRVSSQAGRGSDDHDSLGSQIGAAFVWAELEEARLQLVIPSFPATTECP